MKSLSEVNLTLENLPSAADESRFPGMTYEQGVEEALLWVVEEISDEEFAYSPVR